MDQYTGNMEMEFYIAKCDFMQSTCKKFSNWKSNGKPAIYTRHNNALEDIDLIKIANDSQWKLCITVEYTGKAMPQRNRFLKLGFADVAGMMVQANLPEGIKYKLCKECFNCATYESNLAVVTLKGKTATRYEHSHEAKLCCAKQECEVKLVQCQQKKQKWEKEELL